MLWVQMLLDKDLNGLFERIIEEAVKEREKLMIGPCAKEMLKQSATSDSQRRRSVRRYQCAAYGPAASPGVMFPEIITSRIGQCSSDA